MLKLSDLANRANFDAGPLRVSPALRRIEGPAGSANVEPIVMKVFLLLLDAGGSVVTRDELFGHAWGGVFVGDDSLNRVIAKLRRTGEEVAPGAVDIETVPRTGYRLRIVGERPPQPVDAHRPAGHIPRRNLLLGGAVAAVAGASGLWWFGQPKRDPRFDELMDRGETALRLDQPSANYFRQAVAIQPKNARAWGLLAYSLTSAPTGSAAITGQGAQQVAEAARTALAIDANESNALLAMAVVQSDVIDWIAREDRYRAILAIDPQNPRVMRSLGQLLHGVGRCRESLEIVERALVLEPLTPDHWVRKAMRLWVLGRLSEADPVIDRAMQYWPTHRLVRLGRLMIYAFTGRARAALAIVEEEEARPIFVSAAGAAVWRTSLAAIETPTASAVAAARKANLEGSQGSPQIAAWAILTMSALGELDAAFEVANGFLLDRGSVIVRPRPDPRLPRVNSLGWRNTFGLFTPPTKAMRLDPRFGPLSDGLGLNDYWRRRGIGPDAFLMRP